MASLFCLYYIVEFRKRSYSIVLQDSVYSKFIILHDFYKVYIYLKKYDVYPLEVS